MPLKLPKSEYGEYYREDGTRVRYPTRLFKNSVAYDVSRASEGALQRTPPTVLRLVRERISHSRSYGGGSMIPYHGPDAIMYDGLPHSPEFVRSAKMDTEAVKRIDAELLRRRSDLRRE